MNRPTYLLTHSLTHLLTHPSTHHVPTHSLTHPPGLSPDCDLVKHLLQEKHPDVTSALEKVSYSSRYVAAIHYGPDAWPAILKDTQEGGGWSARYVGSEDDAVVFISIDSAKRKGGDVRSAAEAGSGSAEGPSVLVHGAVPWTIEQLREGRTHEVRGGRRGVCV